MQEITISQKGTAINKLMFIFHGYGASKENFRRIGEEIFNRVNDIEIRIPDGIEYCEGSLGYQWFPFIGDDIYDHRKAFNANKPQIMTYIQNVINSKKTDLQNVILSGFSQGAMIALSIGLEMGVGKIISFSGMFMGDSNAPIKSKKTKILMTHGDKDPVMSIDAMYNSRRVLENRGLKVNISVSRGIQHGIDNTALEAAIRFIGS